jgi:predicted peptidase
MKKIICSSQQWAIVICLLLSTMISCSQPAYISPYSSLYAKQQFVIGYDSMPYRLLTPKNFDSSKKYPLIIFLHGSGERGNQNEDIILKHPGAFFANDSNRTNFPCFVLMPQCKQNSWWSNATKNSNSKDAVNGMFSFPLKDTITLDTKILIALIKAFSAKPYINNKKIAIGGLSMGGMGTFELLWRMPNFFSCAFPICGGGSVEKVNVKNSKNLPIKIFHGLADNAVKPIHSKRMYEALKRNKANVSLIEYQQVQHNSWVNAFAEPWLMEWIVTQEKK